MSEWILSKASFGSAGSGKKRPAMNSPAVATASSTRKAMRIPKRSLPMTVKTVRDLGRVTPSRMVITPNPARSTLLITGWEQNRKTPPRINYWH